jgi:Ca2+-binding EF-hand superfamily protein
MGKVVLGSALLAVMLIMGPAVHAARAGASEADRVLGMADPDKDGSIDLNEAKTAAGALFDRLDKDKDGTLTIKELQGRLSRKDFKAADPDNDATLTKDEFMAVVDSRFMAANPDNDGTIDKAEFGKPAGRALMRLLH